MLYTWLRRLTAAAMLITGHAVSAAAPSGVEGVPTAAGATLVTFGVWGNAAPWGHSLDNDVRSALGHSHGASGASLISHGTQLLPVAGLMLLEPLGAPARHDWRGRALEGASTLVIAEAVSQTLKHTVRRTRPDGSDTHSFPSGHSAVAFAGAELCRIEYGAGWGAAAYATAAATAWLRIRADRHWLTDVAAGAGIGILSAQGARLLLPLEEKWLRISTSRTVTASDPHLTVLPGACGTPAGLSLTLTF